MPIPYFFYDLMAVANVGCMFRRRLRRVPPSPSLPSWAREGGGGGREGESPSAWLWRWWGHSRAPAAGLEGRGVGVRFPFVLVYLFHIQVLKAHAMLTYHKLRGPAALAAAHAGERPEGPYIYQILSNSKCPRLNAYKTYLCVSNKELCARENSSL